MLSICECHLRYCCRARFVPAVQATPSCVAVRFDSFTARVGGLPEAALSLAWLRPLGYVDTLYLDAGGEGAWLRSCCQVRRGHAGQLLRSGHAPG